MYDPPASASAGATGVGYHIWLLPDSLSFLFFFLNLNEYLAKLNSCCRSAVSSLSTNASTI